MLTLLEELARQAQELSPQDLKTLEQVLFDIRMQKEALAKKQLLQAIYSS